MADIATIERAEWREQALDAKSGFDDSAVGADEETDFVLTMANAMPRLLDSEAALLKERDELREEVDRLRAERHHDPARELSRIDCTLDEHGYPYCDDPVPAPFGTTLAKVKVALGDAGKLRAALRALVDAADDVERKFDGEYMGRLGELAEHAKAAREILASGDGEK